MKRNQNTKIRKSWVAMAAAAAMMIGSCMSVCAATAGASGLYDEMFRVTRDQAKETALVEDVIEHTGTADELFEGLIIEETPDARSTAINWTIKKRVVKKTAYFSRKSGDTIRVAGVIDPDNVTIQVGIIEPDDHLRYIDAKGSFAHTFNLTKNGSYKVYIENLNSVTVTVNGGYS